jgi:hypothetical protein
MKRTILIAAGALALLLGTGTAGLAATPSSVAVSPASTLDSWSGASFLAGATSSPAACPQSIDSSNTLCDHISLDVGVTSGYWDTHSGGIRVTITWPDSSDNFDLYVYNSAGASVGSSTGSGSASESVSLANAAGGYEIRVVPVLVTASGYSGKVSFSSQVLPTSSTTSSSSGGGTSGSTSGTTSGTTTGSTSGSGSTATASGTGGTGSNGVSSIQGPVANYSFSGYGGSAPGGLFYAPYPGSAGGGTTYFGAGQGSGRVVYASAYGGQVSSAVADQVGEQGQGRQIGSTIARTTWLLWLLLALGVILLALVTYVIVEPEGESDRVISLGRTRARLPVPPLALAGGFVRGLAAMGHVLSWLARTVTAPHQRT